MTARHPLLSVSLVGGLVIGLTSCSPPTPIIPDDIVAIVDDEGRMRTYDLAWQNTRMLNDAVARGDDAAVAEQVVVLTARLHRLETASAGSMADWRTAGAIEDFLEQARERSPEANRERLAASAKALQDAFDEGDFPLAKHYCLEVFALVAHRDQLVS